MSVQIEDGMKGGKIYSRYKWRCTELIKKRIERINRENPITDDRSTKQRVTARGNERRE
jgi:hypothetical protein